MAPAAVRFEGITRRFPGVVALDDVSFEVAAGACHAVCGENGAGKSTLGKILAGIQRADAGRIFLDGREVSFGSPREAHVAGVAMVHQELAFCENMTVAENLCLGQLPSRWSFVNRSALRRRATEMLSAVGASIEPTRQMNALSVAEQQLVQIAAAVGSGARVIVFDEPTSSLSEGEAERLYELLGELKERGVTVLYVSHRMPEIFRLCGSVTVLRDGRHVSTQPIDSVDEGELVRLMIGRRLEQYYPEHVQVTPREELLRVERLSSFGRFNDIFFSLRAGEVLGFAGLVGAGRSELAQAIFGLDRDVTGEIRVRGQRVKIRNPREAMALGIGFVPEDRKRQGLVLPMRARENTTLPTLESLARLGWVRSSAERELAQSYIDRLRVRTHSMDAATAGLSGGNQQKLVLAKWLAAKSDILILDEPTRGVDVGAKAEIHAWIDRLASEGAAILLISSELPELINLSTRLIVLRAGRIVGEVARAEATQDGLLRLMAGLDAEDEALAAATSNGGRS
ncbi:MAG TPA: sugar ABC transporter ATP-binding protein, partial [Gemmatimonadaceae bacterium]|nr:sugar ABC transporter ATP-binding protein [Gemmatimonadaceae bacterium]